MEQNYKAVILIVDDKQANLFALEQLLVNDDRDILVASSGKDALKIALNKPIDLIILDVQMPEMDGFEVAQVLKSNNKTRDIPIIFASAERTEHQFMMKGFEEGAIDYFFKPLSPEIVKAKVNVHLKIQLQKKELIDKNNALQKSALLINNSADIIGIIDVLTFIIEDVNLAFTSILGYSVAEARGMAITSFLIDDDKALFSNHAKQLKEFFSFDTRVFCKDKSIKWLQWKVVGKNKKWFVNARDITQQKITDEQINQLNNHLQNTVSELSVINKELESFSYSVSHDLRAPLRAINVYFNMFEEYHWEILNDDAKKLLKRIQYNSQKMGGLIDDLLAFSKLGRKEVQKSEVNIQEIVTVILKDINNATPYKALIKVNELPVAYADKSLMYQVWMNLISNAIKYSEKKEMPEVEIGAINNGDETIYYVKDNGAGFDMKYVDKLFGVFQRLHSANEFEGTGIGLAIVQRIIEKHGGRIWAESKVNEGATFYFTLPPEKQLKQ